WLVSAPCSLDVSTEFPEPPRSHPMTIGDPGRKLTAGALRSESEAEPGDVTMDQMLPALLALVTFAFAAPGHAQTSTSGVRARAAFPPSETQAIADTLMASFHAREFDQGLLDAVRRISEDAARSPAPGHTAAEAPEPRATRAPDRALQPTTASAEEKDNRVRG